MNFSRKKIVAGAFVVGLVLALIAPESLIFRTDKSADESGQEASDTKWACPMFCVVMDEKPEDGRCPVCGMALGPVSSGSHLNHDERAMIGLESVALQEIVLEKEILLYGEIDWDETRLSVVSARTTGWIEKLTRKITWEEISVGDVLYEIYAPELYEAQQELLIAAASPDLASAARQRLLLLGLEDQEIAAIAKLKEPNRVVARRSTHAGVIVRRSAKEGGYVNRGAEIFAIADLSHVWLQLEAFEPDLRWLAPNTRVNLRDLSFGNDSFEGRIVFADPVVDRATRTARVRVELKNRRRADGRWALIPGQRLEAQAKVAVTKSGAPVLGEGSGVAVLGLPRTSVLRTGKRAVVYVLYDASRHEPFKIDPKSLPKSVGYAMVEVEIGPLVRRAGQEALEEYFPFLRIVPGKDPNAPKALEPGMVIATKGAFLIDSQAQLAGKPSLLFPDGRSMPAATGHEHH